MFASGTQKRHWMFTGAPEIDLLRREANERFVNAFGQNMDSASKREHFLTPAEEKLMMRHFEFILSSFCKKFNPTMPKYVQGTALTYFKRFYIHNSIMDFHPKDLILNSIGIPQMYTWVEPPIFRKLSYTAASYVKVCPGWERGFLWLTCVYLSCKVEEFNVSIGQFVGNLKGDREKFANIILGFELLLMDKLHYHLTVHNPFRPLEGFLIDLKTRYFKDKPESVERLRKSAEEFVEKSMSTNACLIFAPSQIALAAVICSAAEEGISLDNYVTSVLLSNAGSDEIKKMAQQIKRWKSMVKNQEHLQRELIGPVQRKLENCRNQSNNPESEVYKRRLEEMFEEEEEERSRKRARIAKEEKETEKQLLGY